MDPAADAADAAAAYAAADAAAANAAAADAAAAIAAAAVPEIAPFIEPPSYDIDFDTAAAAIGVLPSLQP